MCDRPPALSVAHEEHSDRGQRSPHATTDSQCLLACRSRSAVMRSSASPAHSAERATTVAILQGLRSRDGGHVAVLGLHPARERDRGVPSWAPSRKLRLVDRLRVGEAVRLADRPCSMFPRAAALYGIRHARATLGWAADIRLILRDPGVSLVSVRRCRAAGGGDCARALGELVVLAAASDGRAWRAVVRARWRDWWAGAG